MNKYVRWKGFPPSLVINEGFYDLIYTNHAKERFKDRNPNDPIIPHLVNITKSNIDAVFTEDNITINKLIVKILYRKACWGKIFMYLVVIPHESVVKTLWFEEKKFRTKKL